MKILKLRFKNLNSLYGEWHIDFTCPEYSADGIFALTGPTGAGKSTILDAICIALYGATPRLGRITKNANEIMSRQTGECYAELEFESQAGRFLCHWEQRRARKKADGSLQDQEHQIVDANTGKPIETKKSLVVKIIEEKTGMDFDRFTRSILLAQGGFDNFLKANTEQKSKILEQITGTEIYSEISRRVHERQREEQEKLKQLRIQVSDMAILEPEEEKEIQQKFELGQKEEIALAAKISETSKAIACLTRIENLKKEIISLTNEAEELQVKKETFKPERIKLKQANKAATLDETYATLSALRKEQSSDENNLKTEENAVPEWESSVRTQNAKFESAKQVKIKKEGNLKEALPIIQKIRLLDQKIEEQKKAVLEITGICARETKDIEANRQNREEEKEKRGRAENKLAIAETYLDEHMQDEWLISGLAGIEEQFGNLLAKQEEIERRKDTYTNAEIAMAEATKKMESITQQCTLGKQEQKEVTEKLQREKHILRELLEAKLLREYRNEKEALLREMAYIKKIEELESLRKKLEDGKACPLCGSTEHPFAEGNVPISDEIDHKISSLNTRIDRAEAQEDYIKKLEQEEKAAHKNLIESEKQESNASNNKNTAEKSLKESENNLVESQNDFEKLKASILEKLQALSITEIPESETLTLLESLKSRLETWQEQNDNKVETEKHIALIDSEIKRLDAVIETQLKNLREKQRNLNHLEQEQSEHAQERKKLYGDKNPDEEEESLNQALAEAKEAETQAGNIVTDLQNKLTKMKTRIETLKKRIEQRTPDLEKVEKHFASAYTQAGFTDEQFFLEARLSHEERESLSSRAKALDDEATEIKARLEDRETQLNTENAKKISSKSIEELEPQLEEYENSLKHLQSVIAGFKYSLQENEKTQERLKEKQDAIEMQKKECLCWEKLHGLIGSSDGKKYRNFAQGLTFERMVSHANRQLEKMTDRYLLIRDEQDPLELNVVDNYQGGEIRSSKNLSGGESFIVSLTLALGLSKMASRKVQVDSLFLDEGFGTLDEEALETALETLSGLHQDGKLIGIISHVSALKERIGTQISLVPLSGGRSSLSGPGCAKIIKGE